MLSIILWLLIILAFTPLLWLIIAPYRRLWSSADRRAASLLRDTLTREQQRQLLWTGYLEVPSPTDPQRMYRIPRVRGYVQVLEHGRLVMRLCLQPVEHLPEADLVVMHTLMIEANEEQYLKQANKYLCLE